jgi:hypothetical protein
MNRRLFALMMTLAGLCACTEPTDASTFSEEAARSVVQEFARALEDQRYEDAAALCKEPFVFRDRTMTGSLLENLKARAGEILTALKKATSLDVFSYRDLMAGRWPRGRVVPPESRDDEARALGIGQEGYWIMTMEERRPGVQFIANPSADGTRLRIVSLTP